MYVGIEKSNDRATRAGGYGMGLGSSTLQAKDEMSPQQKRLDFQSHIVKYYSFKEGQGASETCPLPSQILHSLLWHSSEKTDAFKARQLSLIFLAYCCS